MFRGQEKNGPISGGSIPGRVQLSKVSSVAAPTMWSGGATDGGEGNELAHRSHQARLVRDYDLP